MLDKDFECDDQKSETNKARHGIDFEEARNLWRQGVDEYPSPRGKEMRYVAFGKLNDRLKMKRKPGKVATKTTSRKLARTFKKRSARLLNRRGTTLARSRAGASALRRNSDRDEVLERFDRGESIAKFIDFSAGKFVKIP